LAASARAKRRSLGSSAARLSRIGSVGAAILKSLTFAGLVFFQFCGITGRKFGARALLWQC
jgi:hypothetical protein